MLASSTTRLFDLGRLSATPGALAAFRRNGGPGPTMTRLLTRHLAGDWGDVPPEDAAENEFSLTHGYRILSSYRLADETRIWIITEADRSATTALLPEEY